MSVIILGLSGSSYFSKDANGLAYRVRQFSALTYLQMLLWDNRSPSKCCSRRIRITAEKFSWQRLWYLQKRQYAYSWWKNGVRVVECRLWIGDEKPAVVRRLVSRKKQRFFQIPATDEETGWQYRSARVPRPANNSRVWSPILVAETVCFGCCKSNAF